MKYAFRCQLDIDPECASAFIALAMNSDKQGGHQILHWWT